MIKTEKFKNKQVLVLGLAVSGYNAAKLLLRLGAEVIVNDFKDLSHSPEAAELQDLGIEVISGGHPSGLLERSLDYIVKNPGIPYTNPLIKKAVNKNIPIITEVELAYLISESPIIAITGTNGKTTTTKMIETVMNHDRQSGKAYAVGNIGTSASLVAQSSTGEDDMIMEVSSFQLMGTESFSPSIAVITNVYSAHLDYHKTREEYVAAKLAITKNQSQQDYLVYNGDQDELSQLISDQSAAQLVPFSRKTHLENGVCVQDDWILFNNERVMRVEEIQVPGIHNLENALATIGVAKTKEVPNETIKSAFNQFRGVAHRMQLVDTVNERTFYNDSKATNTLATIHAIESFKKPVILIAGGLDRNESFEDLIPLLNDHVKAVITFGETRERLASVANAADVKSVDSVETVSEATKRAYNKSMPSDIILLSPACASWDQYANFEERGNDYMNTIADIKKSVEEA